MIKLTKEQEKTLEKIRELEIFHDFYLAGGTALLIKYHHRFSEDFDFFLLPTKRFNLNLYERTLIDYFGSNFKIVYEDRYTLIFILNEIKISLFEYPYTLLKKLELKMGIYLASDEDIACMKVDAISKRGLKKDFFDLWYLIKLHNWDIQYLFGMLQEKYKEYNPVIFLKSLVFFKDAEKSKDFAIVEEKWEEIKSFFIDYVRSFGF